MIAVSVHVGVVVEFRRTGETANWADLEYSHFKRSFRFEILTKAACCPAAGGGTATGPKPGGRMNEAKIRI